MSQRFDFWTNGIATIMESPEIAKLVQHRTDLGTVVEQDANTQAWFHIPIPTPTIMESDTTIYLRVIALRAKLNENANIDRIHIRRGTDLIFDKAVSYTNTTVVYEENVPAQLMGQPSQLGLAMSIHVRFLSGQPRGRIEFKGAGAGFY